MPIYEYNCKKCGEEIEILHKVDEKPNEPCPACGSRALARKISAAGFRLAGGGWYETDFKKNGQKNLKGDKADAKSDTKKEAKTEAAACKPTGCEKPGCAAKAA